MNRRTAEVDLLLQKHGNRPLKALWVVLNDKSNPGNELPMAIIMDRRCGIERRAELADGPMSKGGQTINAKGREGATPLIIAVQAGRNDVVSALLANGADYEATFTTFSNAAIHIAAIINNVGAIELLASYGADVSRPNKYNIVSVHNAAYNGHAAAIEVLLRLGADLVVNSNGRSPLQSLEANPQLHLSEDEKDRLKALLTPKAEF